MICIFGHFFLIDNWTANFFYLDSDEVTNNEVNTIELMVFVDSAFMQKYRHLGSRGVDQYVATVVGIMADLYQHPSIGKPLKEW